MRATSCEWRGGADRAQLIAPLLTLIQTEIRLSYDILKVTDIVTSGTHHVRLQIRGVRGDWKHQGGVPQPVPPGPGAND